MSDSFFTLEDEQIAKKTDKVLFRTASEFSIFITNLARQNEDTLTHTILQYCEDRDLDPEDVAKLISKPLKDLIAIEMQESGLLQKESSAQFDL